MRSTAGSPNVAESLSPVETHRRVQLGLRNQNRCVADRSDCIGKLRHQTASIQPTNSVSSTKSPPPTNSLPSDRPDPREIPVPDIPTALGNMPGVDDLPVRLNMPDVMIMNDGTRVTTTDQWKHRREEMKRILEYYAVGLAPPSPENVTGEVTKTQLLLNGRVKYRLVHLSFGPNHSLSLNIGIFTPVEGGPFPAIIMPGGTPPGARLSRDSLRVQPRARTPMP